MVSPVGGWCWRAAFTLCATASLAACAQPTTVLDSPRARRDPVDAIMNFTPRWVYLRSVDSALARRQLQDQAEYALDTWQNMGVVFYHDNNPLNAGSAPSVDSLGPACGINVSDEPILSRATLSQDLDSFPVFPVWKKTTYGIVDSLASDKARLFLSTYRSPDGGPLVVLVPLIGFLDASDMVIPMAIFGATPGLEDRTLDGSIWLASETLKGDSALQVEPMLLSHEMIHLLDDVPHNDPRPQVKAWGKICHIFTAAPICGQYSWVWDADLASPGVRQSPAFESRILTLVQTSGHADVDRNQCQLARSLQRFIGF